MKTLKNHKLIFDNACPLCRTYSNAFVKTGMLDTQGREAYQQMNTGTFNLLDTDRARNEIALINTETGSVTYGIDSILKIVGNSFPLFNPLFRLAPFRWLLKRLYCFISYNRKVIIPGQKTDTCVPDINLKYRWAYIIFTWLITSVVLTKYSFHLVGLVPASKFFREFIVCGGQLLFQSAVLWYIGKDKLLAYLGNMMTISFAGALLLSLFLLLGKIFVLHGPYLYAIFFMSIVALMLIEHIRRVKLLEIPWSISLSWVLYRMIVLLIIL